MKLVQLNPAPPFRTGGQSSRWQDGDNQRDHGCAIRAAHFQGPPTRPRWQKVECSCLKLVWSLPGSVLCIPANLAPLGPLLLLLKQHPIPVQTDTQRVSALHVQHTPHTQSGYILALDGSTLSLLVLLLLQTRGRSVYNPTSPYFSCHTDTTHTHLAEDTPFSSKHFCCILPILCSISSPGCCSLGRGCCIQTCKQAQVVLASLGTARKSDYVSCEVYGEQHDASTTHLLG